MLGGRGVLTGSLDDASSQSRGIGRVKPLCGWSNGTKKGSGSKSVDDEQTPLVYKSRKVGDEWFAQCQMAKSLYGESVLRDVRYPFKPAPVRVNSRLSKPKKCVF